MKIRHLIGIALAGAIVLGATSRAQAQFSMAVGNPWTGQGVVMGNNPYVYGAPGTYMYSRGYGGVAGAPMAGYYNPGYASAYALPRPRYGYGVVAPRYYRAPMRPNIYRGRGYAGRRFYGW